MTISIREFESQFDSKLQEINNVPWLEIKLKLIFDCYNLLNESLSEQNRFSYNAQLLSLLNAVIRQFDLEDLSKINPKYLRLMLKYLSRTTDAESVQKIVFSCGKLYLRLKDYHTLIKIAQDYHFYSGEIEKEIPNQSIREFLHERSTNFDPELAVILENEYGLMNSAQSSNNSINGLFAVHHGEHTSGTVASLSLMNVSISNKYGTDMVRFANHLVDENDILSDQAKDVCSVMKKYFNHAREDYYKLEYSIDQPLSLLRGNSLGLAMALLAYAGLEDYKKNAPMEYHIYRDVALTGALDKNGIITPVSKTSLKSKIEAAFFSRINSIVIPEKQFDFAQQCLSELKKEYPDREFEIIAGKSFNGVLKRRDIIFKQRRKIKKRIGQFVHEYANIVTYSIMVFILLLAAGFWFGIVKHPVPVEVENVYEEHLVYVKNKFGFTIWKSAYGGVHGRVYDLNQDSNPEVLINYSSNADADNKGQLVCYTSKGEKLWQFDVGDEVSYGDNVYSDYFGAGTIYIEDLNDDGTPEIFSIGSQGYFPTRLFILNWQGKLVSEYWHTGSPGELIVAEIFPDNGTREIVFCGRNNEYKSGILVVIDPFKIKGQSPFDSHYYTKQGTDLGNEIYYIRFPETHYRFVSHRDITTKLFLNENGDIKVWLSSSFSWKVGHIEYVFDQSLNVKFVDIADNYYRLYAKTFPDREMLVYNDPELINYFRQIDYWDGDNWTKERIVNRRYLETLKNQKP